jgi:hypothetical protein
MSPTLAEDLRRALILTVLATAATAVAAVIVHSACAASARALLGYRFPGVPAEPAEAWSIFAHNLRKLAGIYGLALVLQAPWLDAQRTAADRPRWHPALATVCDLGVAGALAGTFTAVILGLGGYGAQMGRALLPHGPLEVSAFALAIMVYLAAREGPVDRRRAATLATASIVLLALAAVLETFVPLSP